jgi:hypothetical protein
MNVKVPSAYKRTWLIPLLLFLTLFVTFAYFYHPAAGWNVNSRICLTYAMVERGTFAITEYQKIKPLYTEDRAIYKGEYYSDKIIGTSLLGAIPMAALHLVSRATGREFSWDVKRYVVETFSVKLLAALAGVAMYRLLLLFGSSPAGAVFLAVAFFFGTQMFSVSTIFLSYAPATCFLLLSYLTLVKDRDCLAPPIPPAGGGVEKSPPSTGGIKGGARPTRVLLGAGLAIGMALLCEYTFGIVAVGLGLYALYHLERRRAIIWFAIGAALPLLLFLAYTIIVFGAPTIPYEYLENEEFRSGMSRGFQGITGFRPVVLYLITFHPYRGLFYHSPFLLLAIWGWIAMLRDRYAVARPEGRASSRADAVLSIAMAAGYLAFNASYYMWWGGWTNGPRHLIPMLPFLIVPLAYVWRSGRVGRALLVATFSVSFVFNALPALVDAQIPQGYKKQLLYRPHLSVITQDPLVEGGLKALRQGIVAMNGGRLLGLRGLWSLAPISALLIGAFAVLYFRARRDERHMLLKGGS